MSTAARFRVVAGGFGDRAAGVPAGAWDRPAPCDRWVARDIVRHLVEWVPPFLRDGAGIELAEGPSVDDDPVAAWGVLANGLQALLDDPSIGERRFSHPRAGDHPLDAAIGMFILGDVLVHTWDLARATGQDETLDPTEVHNMREGLEPIVEMLAHSGQYAPALPVAADADEQTRLLALTGRRA